MQNKLNKLQEKYPNLSSLMCYIKLMKGKSNTLKRKWFKLVDKEDYRGVKMEEILEAIFAIN